MEGMKPIVAICPIGPVEHQWTGKPKMAGKLPKKTRSFHVFPPIQPKMPLGPRFSSNLPLQDNIWSPVSLLND